MTQFAVSIVLIIGTIVIFKQVQFAKNRPIGYSRDGLVDIEVTNTDLHDHFEAFRSDMLKSGTVANASESSSSTTGVSNDRGDISWQGKDPALSDYFGSIRVSTDYGKTVGWQFVDGRDFANGNISDSLSVVLNEAAVKYTGLKNPVGQILHVGKRDSNSDRCDKKHGNGVVLMTLSNKLYSISAVAQAIMCLSKSTPMRAPMKR